MAESDKPQKRQHQKPLLTEISFSHSLSAGEAGEESREKQPCVKARKSGMFRTALFSYRRVSGVKLLGQRAEARGQAQIMKGTETTGTSYGKPKGLNF